MMHTLSVDFNNITDGTIWARSACGVLPLGITVCLDDGEGLRCQATLLEDGRDWKGQLVDDFYVAKIHEDTYEDYEPYGAASPNKRKDSND
jgi:hypothetical protein